MNKEKYDLIRFNRASRVKFRDNALVPLREEARYLGCWLNNKGDPARELKTRMAQTMAIWKKLQLYFIHADDTYNFRIQVYNAIVRSKLLYGLETVEVNSSIRNKIDIFHRRGSRQIFQIPTTHIDRTKTNRFVMDFANAQLRAENPTSKPIVPLTQIHDDMKIRMLYRILRMSQDNPHVTITFEDGTLHPIDIGKRRSGRPRIKWLDNVMDLAWRRITRSKYPHYMYQNFDADNEDHVRTIREAAKTDFIGYL